MDIGPGKRGGGGWASESAQLLLDPLQERRAELIWTYDLHGYPERARYLERAQDGPALLGRLREGDPDAPRDLLGWWTGRPAIEAVRLEHSMFELIGAERGLRGSAPPCPSATVARLQCQRNVAGEALRALLDDALNTGLLARVNTYMAPLGLASADTIAYAYLGAWRELSIGRLAAQAPLPPVTLPGGMVAHVVYCERCSVVDLHRRPARRCRRCADRHDREPGSLRIPKTDSQMPWLVVGDSTAHLRTCKVCGEPFVSQRKSAETHPSGGCRQRRHRQRPLASLTS